MESPVDKMAALKARVAAAIGSSKAKGGLNVGLHPALEDLGTWKPPAKSHHTTHAPKRLHTSKTKSLKLGSAQVPTPNPYYSDYSEVPASNSREPRQLVFNQKGKYIQQANALRRQAALEAMKKRIAEQTRKAVEWWDEGLVKNDMYLDDDITLRANRDRIRADDSIVTEFIQHPVIIEPAQDRNVPPPKPMYLTTKEQKNASPTKNGGFEGKTSKRKAGTHPGTTSKSKKANLMRVLGEEAVKDPTAVEARVNREISDRKQKHLEINEERKLTKQQKHEKINANHEKDAAKGIHLVVFKIGSLANGQHRFKVNKNAEQLALTGICVMHPTFNLLIAEGGEHSIRQYRKLVVNRIDWTENSPSRLASTLAGTPRLWLQAEDEQGLLKDLSSNSAHVVFEGQVKVRAFRKWGSKVCETDAEVRELLARYKMENFWTLAKGDSYDGPR
ncbi:unnamed protein product [Parascedosporium putredinis]|uniref:Uncharacterized protein n=1 Tax=Parascedosporium putredinis TaxID=1442378 RepID=A0A9P1GZK4_9PEZI|nr:unnamed protein product [Parascedosporium putredinis]CAI7990890.1 unnamed protein product [Parascedosporium putredinis]